VNVELLQKRKTPDEVTARWGGELVRQMADSGMRPIGWAWTTSEHSGIAMDEIKKNAPGMDGGIYWLIGHVPISRVRVIRARPSRCSRAWIIGRSCGHMLGEPYHHCRWKKIRPELSHSLHLSNCFSRGLRFCPLRRILPRRESRNARYHDVCGLYFVSDATRYAYSIM